MNEYRPNLDDERRGRAGTVSIMESRPTQDTTREVQIPVVVLAQMRDDFERMREYQQIDALDQIRVEFGIGWAIYASAFMGREVDPWRVDVCGALSA